MPASRVPFEIVSHIFVLCLPKELNAPLHPNDAPLVLTRISRSWRAIAFGTPVLWAHLRLPTSNHPSIIPAIHKWLSASQTRPLTLIADLDYPEPITEEMEKNYIKALSAHSRRWNAVSLSVCREAALGALSSCLDGETDTTPRLQKLDLAVWRNVNSGVDRPWVQPILDRLQSCVSLQSLGIWEWHQITSLGPFTCPSLRNLLISFQGEGSLPFDMGALINCIRHCPNLIRLEIDLPRAHRFTTGRDIAQLPNLETLKLNLHSFGFAHFLFKRLFTPHLQALTLSVAESQDPEGGGDDALFVDSFCSLLETCRRTLHTLELGFDTMLQHALARRAIYRLSALTSFGMDNMTFSPSNARFFQGMTLQPPIPEGEGPMDMSTHSIMKTKNVCLHTLRLELAPLPARRLEGPHGLEYDEELLRDMEQLVVSVICLLTSRQAVSMGQIPARGRPVRSLDSFVMGYNFAKLYRHDLPMDWPLVDDFWRAWIPATREERKADEQV
ncbi:uncharacterized protein STEHIDRAFT_156104 [Stereum hirsutum FP-91666 SS1]|uniref:uncharacterized protein n=1 Tax=Stereum hirsutum (strain FP-91666) TaxID=721885 RepID=UPI000440B1AB|nr:uncharacterized protein STEHIDRAFT_156104 [Stereum hirsutum FP-91666 SS1]EIM87113.1 hypothetical protein STEHIDRAFT_156104 [Stereum hirsutum FP-91666 SS1]